MWHDLVKRSTLRKETSSLVDNIAGYILPNVVRLNSGFLPG